MLIMTVDVYRTHINESSRAIVDLIYTNSSNGITRKLIKDKDSFKEMAEEVVQLILEGRPEKLIIYANGIGKALDEVLPKELSLNGVIWYKDATLVYRDKERK